MNDRFERVAGRLPSFLLGASAGLLLAWAIARRGGDGEAAGAAADDTRRSTWERWSDTWEDAVEGLASARARIVGADPESPDLEALTDLLRSVKGAERVDLRGLRNGIVEIVGSAPDEATVTEALDLLAKAPGVSVVVNRVWTPSSSAHSVPGSARGLEPGPPREGR